MKNPMSYDDQIAIIKAKKGGAVLQCRNIRVLDDSWHPDYHVDTQGFNFQIFEYRIKQSKIEGWVAIYNSGHDLTNIGLYRSEMLASEQNPNCNRIVFVREI